MVANNRSLGRSAEALAEEFLKNNGYRILEKNFRTSSGELDIIATDKGVICFVEVKARRSDRFGLPEEAVGISKQARISRQALVYLKKKKLLDKRSRFDVVSLLYSEEGPVLKLIKDAFSLIGDYYI
ncbi:MAG: YraN family protein [Candidatus Omnitrophota bacterium]|nr:YraN family protein [Candidatus Omnitrophota bacterium]